MENNAVAYFSLILLFVLTETAIYTNLLSDGQEAESTPQLYIFKNHSKTKNKF